MLVHRSASFALALLISAVAACGGKVVVDGTGAGTGGVGGQAMSSASTGVDTTACTAYCDTEFANGCVKAQSKCLLACQKELENLGICADEFVALLHCNAKKIAETKTCTGSELLCPELATTVDSCVIPGTDSTVPLATCTNGGAKACECHRDVNGMAYEAACSPVEPVMCTCTKNGQVLGTCAAPVPDNIGTMLGCDLYLGCCAGLFALSN